MSQSIECECPICMESIDIKKNCVTTDCGHCFHAANLARFIDFSMFRQRSCLAFHTQRLGSRHGALAAAPWRLDGGVAPGLGLSHVVDRGLVVVGVCQTNQQ